MTAVAAEKSSMQNRLEGLALSAILQGLPTYAGVVLMMKLIDAREIIGSPGGAAIFVTLASIFHACAAPKLAAWWPKRFGHGYEPLFYDASLSVADKIAQWRTQPKVSVQLVSTVLLLSVLAVAVGSVG